jgi:hypothetical protein
LFTQLTQWPSVSSAATLSKLIEDLNRTLSIENAVIERINARKDETPIQEVKQRLIKHLN